MAGVRGEGLPKSEALLALAKAVGDHYRATGDDQFTVTACPFLRNGMVAVTARFESGGTLTVLTPPPEEGWNAHAADRIAHEFGHVCEVRMKFERIASAMGDARTKEAARAYF